jgi:hypothetical protein
VPRKRNDPEPLPELEPLVEDEEPAADRELPDLLTAFDEEEDLDDSAASELDSGIAMADEEDAWVDRDGPSLDVGQLLDGRGDDETSDPGRDDLGPLEEGGGPLGDETEQSALDDDAEGTEREEAPLFGELPALRTEPGDELEGSALDETDELTGSNAEEPPGDAELPWLEARTPWGSPCQVARRAGERLVGAGSDVLMIDEADAVVKLAVEAGETVTDIVEEADGRTVLYTTLSGELFRVGAGSITAERLTSWRAACPKDPVPALALSVGGPTPSSLPATLLHAAAGGGVLLESTDHGTTWRRVDLGGRVAALSSGVPPLCLVETKEGMLLFRSEPSGGFSASSGEWPIEAEQIGIAGDGNVVVALDPGRGVHVSPDGGLTFRRVRGTAGASAVTAGRLGARPSAFAALFDPACGRTALAWIDATTSDAFVVAHFGSESDEEDDDWARVTSLAWDPHAETLWAAGAFGLRRWRRPPSA